MRTKRAIHHGSAWWPILTLMLTAPVVAELSSGAMAVGDFLPPLIFFAFTVIVYGLPVLVIREIAHRLGLGMTGLWALGMVYGLFNEALFSETLFHPLEAHHETYAGYGVVAGGGVPGSAAPAVAVAGAAAGGRRGGVVARRQLVIYAYETGLIRPGA